jgi:hypothetical protein
MKTRYGCLLLVVCHVLASDCVSAQEIKDELKEQAMPAYHAYRDCVVRTADHYKASTATAHEIADVAQSKCSTEYQAYEKSTEEYLILKFPDMEYRDRLMTRASMTQRTKDHVKGMAVQWVIDNRLQKK